MEVVRGGGAEKREELRGEDRLVLEEPGHRLDPFDVLGRFVAETEDHPRELAPRKRYGHA